MAESDFEFFQSGDYTDPTGGVSGSSILHAELANPLANEGQYGRTYSRPNAPSVSQTIAGYRNSVDNGAWITSDSSFAYSVRAWVRIDDGANLAHAENDMAIGVALKAGVSSGFSSQLRGYWLALGSVRDRGGNGQPTELAMYTMAPGAIGTENAKRVVVATGLATGQWHRIRLDLIPAGDSTDVLRAYTGVGERGSETWTLHQEETIVATDMYNWVPWGHIEVNRIGYIEHAYIGSGDPGQSATYIDGLTVMREAV